MNIINFNFIPFIKIRLPIIIKKYGNNRGRLTNNNEKFKKRNSKQRQHIENNRLPNHFKLDYSSERRWDDPRSNDKL